MTRDRLVLALLLEFLAAFALGCAATLAFKFSQPTGTAPQPEALEFSNHALYDHSLLTSEQMQEANRYGRASFWFDGQHYVVENIPSEYTFKE